MRTSEPFVILLFTDTSLIEHYVRANPRPEVVPIPVRDLETFRRILAGLAVQRH